jgi:glycosyltransferase involved in cell wall biosynthesis
MCNSPHPSTLPAGKATYQKGVPFISIVMPVHDGMATLERAIGSVIAQTFVEWELLAVDDASTDGSRELLQSWAVKDARVKPIHQQETGGPSAARNVALKNARGEFITYLDSDDEYYADYLEQVARRQGKGDVLVFGYDFVQDDILSLAEEQTAYMQDQALNTGCSQISTLQTKSVSLPTKGQVSPWNPTRVWRNFFVKNVVTVLGVAHRLSLLERVGGFNEMLWLEEDWDLWKRFARAGAKFAFLPRKSGRYHVHAGSLSRVPRLTQRQRASVEANWLSNEPIFGLRFAKARARAIHKIAFVSPHCVLDFTSGAAIASIQSLQLLDRLGFQCRAFCGSRLDVPKITVAEMLAQQNSQDGQCGPIINTRQGPLLSCSYGEVPVAVYQTTPTPPGQLPNQQEVKGFYKAYERHLDEHRPDVVLTYGGDPIAQYLLRLTRRRDIPIVFCLHNFSYRHVTPFKLVDYVTVPSEFSRQHHWTQLGLACQRLPNVIDWQRVQSSSRQPKYVTFVNSQPAKGVFVFARIAEVLSRRRPDIPLLVVEGRSITKWWEPTGIDLGGIESLTTMSRTANPRAFYAVTKLLVMPSLWNESFGLIAAEGMINGIPLLASNRGALPETVGDASFLFDIPARYTPRTRTVPTAEEVSPWVETIIRLWDDATLYDRASLSARIHAEQWRPERLEAAYKYFFSNIFHQPGPPIVPMELTSK